MFFFEYRVPKFIDLFICHIKLTFGVVFPILDTPMEGFKPLERTHIWKCLLQGRNIRLPSVKQTWQWQMGAKDNPGNRQQGWPLRVSERDS